MVGGRGERIRTSDLLNPMQGVGLEYTVTYDVELFLGSLVLLELRDGRCSERSEPVVMRSIRLADSTQPA